MHYTIYKTTNLINGKYYIGKHQTENLLDDYYGSGKYLKRAITKYGIENFYKEILFVCESEKHMNNLEKILVVPDSEINYNLCPGGDGGWGYLNDSSETHITRCKKGYQNANLSKYNLTRDYTIHSEKAKLLHKQGVLKPPPSWIGRKHKEETKILIGKKNSETQKGSKNSQFGTVWLNNGATNKKVKKEKVDFYYEQGYTKGRLTK
ncbi:MAG: hypothetical protein [Caudoviricetes sp.]|nr:MAG: hypothetical protein [Caudoviricetes sp.]